MSVIRETPVICMNNLCRRLNVRVWTDDTHCSACNEYLYDESLLDEGEEGYAEYMQPRLIDIKETEKPKPKETDWNLAEMGCGMVKGCPIAKKPAVTIPLPMFNQWIFLANQVDTEWFAYLLGHTLATDEQYEITGFVFPPQTATGGHCEPIDGTRPPEGTIGTIHSHNKMGAVFSGEDHYKFNWPIELVVNVRGEISANGIMKLDCGRDSRGPADIFFTEMEEEENLLAELTSKIIEEKKEDVKQTAPQTQVGNRRH